MCVSVGDSSMPVSTADAHNTADDTTLPIISHCVAEADVDFIDAEQLVASLFGDDDSSVSFEQPRQPTDNKKGFVTADHEDAAKWFYQDPQGVIQGEMCLFYTG